MIVAERKPFEEIYAVVRKHRRVLLLGCGTCVTVCMSGGSREVNVLANQLKLAAREKGDAFEVLEHTITRQCDREFFDEATARKIGDVDAVLSLGCGVGVQFCAEVFPDAVLYPALNTQFFGATEEQGVWTEKCAGCGQCVVGMFAGVCPVARCSKNLLNGPCGGSSHGKCEVNPDTPCAWQLIYDRMEKAGRLDELLEVQPMKDWRPSGHGGPRKRVREDVEL